MYSVECNVMESKYFWNCILIPVDTCINFFLIILIQGSKIFRISHKLAILRGNDFKEFRIQWPKHCTSFKSELHSTFIKYDLPIADWYMNAQSSYIPWFSIGARLD